VESRSKADLPSSSFLTTLEERHLSFRERIQFSGEVTRKLSVDPIDEQIRSSHSVENLEYSIIDDSQHNLILNLFIFSFFLIIKLGIGMQSYEQLNQFYSVLSVMIELINK
jgi:hypothetical protein